MHTEAVWNKFNTLTNNNLQRCMAMSPVMGWMCSIGSNPTKNFRLGHCFDPANLLDLLHNPKFTGSSLSLSELSYLLIRKGCAHHSFPLRATKQNHAFSEGRPKRSYSKIPVFCPLSLVRMWLAYPLPLWSSSSSISHYSMVMQCNSWCSVNTLLIDLVIMICSSKQRHHRQRVHVNNNTLRARHTYVGLLMSTNIIFSYTN